jgi:hypothetical protein
MTLSATIQRMSTMNDERCVIDGALQQVFSCCTVARPDVSEWGVMASTWSASL